MGLRFTNKIFFGNKFPRLAAQTWLLLWRLGALKSRTTWRLGSQYKIQGCVISSFKILIALFLNSLFRNTRSFQTYYFRNIFLCRQSILYIYVRMIITIISKRFTLLGLIIFNLKITRHFQHFLWLFSDLLAALQYSGRTNAINAKVKDMCVSLLLVKEREIHFFLCIQRNVSIQNNRKQLNLHSDRTTVLCFEVTCPCVSLNTYCTKSI